jgi:hypothetical protein
MPTGCDGRFKPRELKMTILTRRAVLGGFALLPASAGAALASSPGAESPRDRCMRLANELSLALGETDVFDDWCIRVARPIDGRPNVFAEPLLAKPEDRVKHHLISTGNEVSEIVGHSGMSWMALIAGDADGVERYHATAFERGEALTNFVDLVWWKRDQA